MPLRVRISGQVTSGRGLASKTFAALATEVRNIVAGPLCPGTLNIVLDRPLRLREDAGFAFDRGKRLLWFATLNGISVCAYRWDKAPLHVVEVVSSTHLRSTLGLRDGDTVTLEMNDEHVRPIGVMGRFLWALAWLGRRDWFYTNKIYFDFVSRTIHIVWLANRAITELKQAMRRISILNSLEIAIRRRLIKPKPYKFSRLQTDDCLSSEERLSRQIRNILNFTKTSGSEYSAYKFPAGYHTIDLNGHRLVGQRNPEDRFKLVPVDFKGKTVLDLGCNQGGMIHHIKGSVRWAVGVDYDSRMINAANRVERASGSGNCGFYVVDLQRDPLDLISDFMPEEKADVCFLLSVCMWLSNWHEVVDFAVSKSHSLLFETNGSVVQQAQQYLYVRSKYRDCQMLAMSSEDDPEQKCRKFYFLTAPEVSNRLTEEVAMKFC